MLIGDIMNNSKKLVICTLIITLLVLAAAASPYSINADAFENVLGKVVFVFVLIVVISTATILNHLMLKDFEGKPISGQLEEIIGERKSLVASDDEKAFVKLTADDAGEYRQQAISTIICEGDAIGAVILCSREEREKMGETESKLVAAAAGFLGRQMEQ